MAGLRGRVKPHNRFFYWAYWRGVEPDTERSRMWLTEPDCAYTFPNEDGLTIFLSSHLLSPPAPPAMWRHVPNVRPATGR